MANLYILYLQKLHAMIQVAIFMTLTGSLEAIGAAVVGKWLRATLTLEVPNFAVIAKHRST